MCYYFIFIWPPWKRSVCHNFVRFLSIHHFTGYYIFQFKVLNLKNIMARHEGHVENKVKMVFKLLSWKVWNNIVNLFLAFGLYFQHLDRIPKMQKINLPPYFFLYLALIQKVLLSALSNFTLDPSALLSTFRLHSGHATFIHNICTMDLMFGLCQIAKKK